MTSLSNTKYAIFPALLASLSLSSCAFRFSIVSFARSSLKNILGGFILRAALRISSFWFQSRKRHTMVLGRVLIPSAALVLILLQCDALAQSPVQRSSVTFPEALPSPLFQYSARSRCLLLGFNRYGHYFFGFGSRDIPIFLRVYVGHVGCPQVLRPCRLWRLQLPLIRRYLTLNIPSSLSIQRQI